MSASPKEELRTYIKDLLLKHGDHRDLDDSESLFLSGRLDSFSMMQLVMFLEEKYGINFSDLNFEVSLLDSVGNIVQLVQ